MIHLQNLQGFTLQNKLFQWIRDRTTRLVPASGGHIRRNNSLSVAANNTGTGNVLFISKKLTVTSQAISLSCWPSISVVKKVHFLKLYPFFSTAVRSNILRMCIHLHCTVSELHHVYIICLCVEHWYFSYA